MASCVADPSTRTSVLLLLYCIFVGFLESSASTFSTCFNALLIALSRVDVPLDLLNTQLALEIALSERYSSVMHDIVGGDGVKIKFQQ
jgi:hypothetical protein